MKNRDRQMSKGTSSYATDANMGSIGTKAAPARVMDDRNAGTMSLDSRGRASGQTIPLTHERVAERAKALWLASGCVPGRDEQNWREAEAQLKAELKHD
jgi:ribosomal protein L3